jgi:hypothetical protein
LARLRRELKKDTIKRRAFLFRAFWLPLAFYLYTWAQISLFFFALAAGLFIFGP